MTTTKKIIATSAAIAFAATLSSCELKKGEEKMMDNNEVKMEDIKEVEINLPEVPAKQANEENPKMKEFQEKQAEMGKLFQEFEKNTPEFKELQKEINAIFSSGKKPSEEDMKKVEEIDGKIRGLFTPEMTALDKELRELGTEIFSQAPVQNEPENNAKEVNTPEASQGIVIELPDPTGK